MTVALFTLDRVVDVLKGIRLRKAGSYETAIHERIAGVLATAGITALHEHAIGPRCRLDYFIPAPAGIVIEVKKDRPSKAAVVEQLGRYAELPDVSALVLVLERSMVLAPTIMGKPLRVVSLNRNWGVC